MTGKLLKTLTSCFVLLSVLCLTIRGQQDASFKALAGCYMKELNADLITKFMSLEELTPMSLANYSLSYDEADAKMDTLDSICVAFNRSTTCAGGRWWNDPVKAKLGCDFVRCIMGTAMQALSSSSPNSGARACTSPDRLANLFDFIAWGCSQPDRKLQYLHDNLLTFIITFRQPRYLVPARRITSIVNNNYIMNGPICVTLRSDIFTLADALRSSNAIAADFFISLMQHYMLNTVTGLNPSDCAVGERLADTYMIPWKWLTMDWNRGSFPVIGDASSSAACDNSAALIAQVAQFAMYWYQSSNDPSKDNGGLNISPIDAATSTTTGRITITRPLALQSSTQAKTSSTTTTPAANVQAAKGSASQLLSINIVSCLCLLAFVV